MLNQARIALVGAILLCVIHVSSFASQAFTLVSSGGATASWAASWLGRFLVYLALPVMLAVWFRSRATITLSRELRRWAVGTALVLGVVLVLNVFLTTLRLLGSSIAAEARSPQAWVLWRILSYVSQLALVLLLIALSSRSGDAAPERNSGFGPLRTAALAATIAAVAAIVLNTTQLVNSASMQMAQPYGLLMMHGGHMENLNRPTLPEVALGFALNSVQPIGMFIIPIIVYRSLALGPGR